MNELEHTKARFLATYNPDHCTAIAAKKAITAAVQHNLLYSKSATNEDKTEVRSYWGECLKEIGGEFKRDVSIAKYEYIIEALKTNLNRRFGSLFDNKSPHGSMLRVSHSQKSISVYVKHLWCIGAVEEPRICPIDRIALNETEARSTRDVAWGYVNSIEEHRRKFRYIEDAAAVANLTVAKWELMKFSQ
jgi:hypothetical protein